MRMSWAEHAMKINAVDSIMAYKNKEIKEVLEMRNRREYSLARSKGLERKMLGQKSMGKYLLILDTSNKKI